MQKAPVFLILYFLPVTLFAQQHTVDSVRSAWSLSLWGDYFIIPDEENIFNPTFYADHKSLHLEGRYNYEDLNTASVFAGWRFETGDKLKLAATPMLGIVFGNTNGIAPGMELELSYNIIDLYTESEYMIDFAGNENNFIYTYSELAATFFHDHLRSGFVGQRTRLFHTALDYDRGFFSEYYFGTFRAGIFYFNPFSTNNFLDASLSIEF